MTYLMKTRQEIKAQARHHLWGCILRCILVNVLSLALFALLLFLSYILFLPTKPAASPTLFEFQKNITYSRPPFLPWATPTLYLVGIALLLPAFCGFYLSVYRGACASIGQWFSSLLTNFWRKLGGFLWMSLWTLLWSYLLVVPGIVKGLAYSMTPYILADSPNVPAREALKLSMRITDGYKMDIFVACLSFLGWLILSAFTGGILGLVYVGPYMQTTLGGIYQELKTNAIENGVIDAAEFGA